MLVEANGYWVNPDEILMVKGIITKKWGTEEFGTRIWFKNAPGSVDIKAPLSTVIKALGRNGGLSEEGVKSLGLDFPNSKK